MGFLFLFCSELDFFLTFLSLFLSFFLQCIVISECILLYAYKTCGIGITECVMFRSECYSVEHNCTDFHCFSRHMQSPAALSLHCSLSQNLWWQSNILPQSPENQRAQLLTVVKMSYFQFGILPGTTIFTNGIMQCMCCPISSGSDFFDFFSDFFPSLFLNSCPSTPNPPTHPFPLSLSSLLLSV